MKKKSGIYLIVLVIVVVGLALLAYLLANNNFNLINYVIKLHGG